MFLFVAKYTATIVLEKQLSNRNRSSVCFRMSEIGWLVIIFNVHKFTRLRDQRTSVCCEELRGLYKLPGRDSQYPENVCVRYYNKLRTKQQCKGA